MQVSVETTAGLERRIKVNVEEQRIAAAVEQRLKDMTRTVKLKGFRKGKVPFNVVKQYYGQQVRQEVMGDVVQSTFYEAVSQEKLRPAGMPNFDASAEQPGEGLEYTATFEVYPEIKPAELGGQTIEKPVSEIAESDVGAMIDTIRKQHIGWQVVERAAAQGDRVNMDFTGSIDGEPFAGGSGKDLQVELGQGRMIKGFEEGLDGAKAGEDRTLDVTFPENYHVKELAGKPARFEVHVNQVEAPVLPEVDAEFAKKLGIADGDLDKLRAEIRANMQRELDERLKARLKEAVMAVLLKANPIDVPRALVDEEARTLLKQMLQNLRSQGMMQQDLSGLSPEMFREQAHKRVSLGLIMSEIVKAHDLKVRPEQVKARVAEIAAPYEHPEEVIRWYNADPRRLGEIESLVFEEQVVDWALQQAKVVEKPVAFSEMMQSQAGK
jgi:trigger factor